MTTDRNDPRLHELRPDGQQETHIILPLDDRAPFIRPVRLSYIHEKCGSVTTMGQAIAETYATNPSFYGSTFCVDCKNYFPVGANGEFLWEGTNEKVGT